jgi:hypothetical protein
MNTGITLGREAGVQIQFGGAPVDALCSFAAWIYDVLLRLIADLDAVLLKIVPPFGLDDN